MLMLPMSAILLWRISLVFDRFSFLGCCYEIFALVRKGVAPALDVGDVHDDVSCTAGGLFRCLRLCQQEASGCGSGHS